MRAEVGDEQHGDDPTVHELCDRMAALMGKEAAMYMPSGTMCNVVAILTHCQKGDEVVAHETSHILHSEGGTHAALTGVQIMPMRGPKGMFTADELRAAAGCAGDVVVECRLRLCSIRRISHLGLLLRAKAIDQRALCFAQIRPSFNLYFKHSHDKR